MIYRCTKNIEMDPTTNAIPFTAFTAGELYEGYESATPLGEWAMGFVNDRGGSHLILADWLREYFELVDEGEREEWEPDEDED